MKVEKKDLLVELRTAKRHASRGHNGIPALKAVHLKRVRNTLQITTTDLDTWCITTAPVEEPKKFVALVDLDRLLKIVTKLTGTLELDQEIEGKGEDAKWTLIVRQGSQTLSLPCLDPSIFPTEPKLEGPSSKEARFRGDDLRMALSKVTYAICTDDSRFALQGVQLSTAKKVVEIAATDGHRLAVVRARGTTGNHLKTLIPTKIVKEILRDRSDGIWMETDGDEMGVVELGYQKFRWRMTGTFPDYNRIVKKPESLKVHVEFDTAALSRLVTRAQVVKQDVPLALRLKGKKIEAFAESDGMKSHDEADSIKFLKGKSATVAFNAAYLQDLLSVIGSERTIFRFDNGDSITQFTPVVEPKEKPKKTTKAKPSKEAKNAYEQAVAELGDEPLTPGKKAWLTRLRRAVENGDPVPVRKSKPVVIAPGVELVDETHVLMPVRVDWEEHSAERSGN